MGSRANLAHQPDPKGGPLQPSEHTPQHQLMASLWDPHQEPQRRALLWTPLYGWKMGGSQVSRGISRSAGMLRPAVGVCCSARKCQAKCRCGQRPSLWV